MKKLLIFVAFMLPFSVIAQNHNEKASKALANLASQLKNTKFLRIEFTFKLDNKEAKIHEEKKGTLWASGVKYRVILDGQIFINDGKTLYTYLPQSSEIHISEPDDEEQSLSPVSLLNNYENKFRIKYIKERKGILTVDLLPVEGSRFYKTRLEISSKTNQLKTVTLYEREGNILAYRVDRFEILRNADSALFTFNPKDYPGAEIVDLR